VVVLGGFTAIPPMTIRRLARLLTPVRSPCHGAPILIAQSSSAIFRASMLMLVPGVRKMARASFWWLSHTRLILLVRASVAAVFVSAAVVGPPGLASEKARSY
jgi:hypothetical protein